METVSDFLAECGGVPQAVHLLTSLSRTLWQMLVTDEQHSSNVGNRSAYRNVQADALTRMYSEMVAHSQAVSSLPTILGLLLSLKLGWREANRITYRPSILNAITLVRHVLHGTRPDHELRYYVWRDVRKYYNFTQSAHTVHCISELAKVINHLIAVRRGEPANPNHAVSWMLHEEVLASLSARITKDFAFPVKALDFFLECCRLVNYIQASDRIGKLDIRAQAIDAEYLLCQLFGIPTGIKGFDELFGGGGLMLVEAPADATRPGISGRAVLTVGPFGSGKSLLTLQMAVEVARKGGVSWLMPMEQGREECLYSLESMGCLSDDLPFTIADSVPKAVEVLENPGQERGALILVRTVKEQFDDFAISFEENAKLMHRYPLRLIIVDPISAISQQDSRPMLRAKMLRLFEAVKNAGTNIWLVLEDNGDEEPLVEQNIADTVIHLRQKAAFGYSQRYIEITKSRLQREQRGLHAFSIGPGAGLTVFPSPAAVRSRLQKRTVRAPNTPIRFGLTVLDSAMGSDSLFSGDVIVLQGQRGTGKSTIALSFLLSTDLARPSEPCDKAMLVTSLESEVAARYQLEMVYKQFGKTASFARRPEDIFVVGMPGGYVKPGYILQKIEDQFEEMRLKRSPIVRVAVDNVVFMETAPFINDDVTFGDTLVDLLRKHRLTSLFVCGRELDRNAASLQQIILNNADCLIQFTTNSDSEVFVEIKKSRGMKHSRKPIPLRLGGMESSAIAKNPLP